MPIDFCFRQPYLANTYPDAFLKVLVRVHYTVLISRDEAMYGQAELQGRQRPHPHQGLLHCSNRGHIRPGFLHVEPRNRPRYEAISFETDHSEI
jgi:hypothetical protein